MKFRFFQRQPPSEVAAEPFRGPGIPEPDHAAFSQIIDRARQLFGMAVEADSIVVGAGRLPVLSVGTLSMVGEQWIVVDVQRDTHLLYPLRPELDWETGVAEAIAPR